MKTLTKKTGFLIVTIMLMSGFFNSVNAAMPEEDPMYSLGTDFLILTAGNGNHNIYSFFNNTNVYVDYQDDGIWDEKYALNAGGSMAITHANADTIKAGTRIHSDKPVEYKQHLGSYWNTVTPIQNLRKEYYVSDSDLSSYQYGICGSPTYHYYHTYYVVVPENSTGITTINIDRDNDGTIDYSVNVSHLSRGEISYYRCSQNNMARIYADKPFYLYDASSLVVPKGTDFYLPWANSGLLIISNNTEVQIDTNNDGVYDYINTSNIGYYGPPSGTTTYGSHIHSNQSICLKTDWGYYVQPSGMTGSDVWSTDIALSYNYYDLITGLFDNTSMKFDKVTENDMISDYNRTINRNTATRIQTLMYVNYWFHVYADKPFTELSDNGYNVFPQSSISSTQYSTQKYLGANELTTMQVNIFNPFARDEAVNLTVTISFPDSFSMSGGNVTLNIEKRYLRNDTVISSDTLTLTPTHTGNKYVFTVSNANSSLFDSLDAMQYFDIKYQIITPSTVGTYDFDPVNVEYASETWNMPQ